MRKTIFWSIALALLTLLPILSQAAEIDDEKTAMELVDLAISKFQEKGKDYTIKLLNAWNGPLRKGELYVFSLDLEGVNLSHPIREDLRGKPLQDLKDVKGKPIVQEFIRIAREDGSGWSEYWWVKPGDKEPSLKRSFIKRVPGESIFVGVGYHPNK